MLNHLTADYNVKYVRPEVINEPFRIQYDIDNFPASISTPV
jgi:hypothetical protein